MAKAILVKINPDILKYARKYSGFSVEEVAKKTKIKESVITDFETNELELSITQLEKLSNVYKRPLAFFLLSKIPTDVVLPKDFRIIFSDENELSFTPTAFMAIRRARYLQSVIEELADSSFEYDFPAVDLQTNTDQLAKWFRGYIGVDFEKQRKTSDPASALRLWKSALESKNIFVLQHSLPKDDISAFCLADKKPYIAVLNSSEHENRRIFSLFHELGHVLLHKSGICTPDDFSNKSYDYIQIEKFCNQFSASLLIPKEVFEVDHNALELKAAGYNRDIDEDLRKIAASYKVSKDVILRRFLSMGWMSEDVYKEKINEWQLKAKDIKKVKVHKELKIPQYIKCVSQNGRGVTNFVLEQYRNNKISFNTAAEILNIGPKHISRLETFLK